MNHKLECLTIYNLSGKKMSKIFLELFSRKLSDHQFFSLSIFMLNKIKQKNVCAEKQNKTLY